MSSPFVAEIRMFGFNFPPLGWATCDGQLLSISQNTALFSLLGTQYGGNGQSNFGLPNLQGSAAMDAGQGAGLSQRFVGESGGSQTVTLLSTEMPLHTHVANAKATGNKPDPLNNTWGNVGTQLPPPNFFAMGSPNTAMNPLAITLR